MGRIPQIILRLWEFLCVRYAGHRGKKNHCYPLTEFPVHLVSLRCLNYVNAWNRLGGGSINRTLGRTMVDLV